MMILSHRLRTKMQGYENQCENAVLSLSVGVKAFGLDARSRNCAKRFSVLDKLSMLAQIISVADPSLAF